MNPLIHVRRFETMCLFTHQNLYTFLFSQYVPNSLQISSSILAP